LDRGSAPTPGNEHVHDIYTVANIITVLRLILVPYFFSVFLTGTSNTLAFVLFALAASTDWLDGQIARRTGTVTAIGKAIDPLVDRLLIASGVIGLYIEKRLPLWLVLVLLARDAYLLYGAWRLEHHHLRMAVTFAGKATTTALLGGFALLILGWPAGPGLGLGVSSTVASYVPGLSAADTPVGIWLVYIGVVLSLSTAVQYTFAARRMVRKGAGRPS
jgi:cardiolipin synthase